MDENNIDNEKLFAIKLADNEKQVRDKCLKKITNYIRGRSTNNDDVFVEEDLIKIWKGLHYAMWMCDKALIQEELNTRICNLIKCFNKNDEQVMLFVKVYFITIIREWNGIDKWRMDKFMMMVRTMLKETFNYLSSKKWEKELVKEFNKIMLKYPLNINDGAIPDGISYHISDIYLEELAKVGNTLKPLRAVSMLQIFIKSMAISTKKPFVGHLVKRLFQQIIECSDIGINPEDEEDLQNTKAFGLQLCEEEDTSEYTVKFNYSKIAENLFKMANDPICITRNKKPIYDLVKKFKALAKGLYPIDDFNLPDLYDKPQKRRVKKKKCTKQYKIVKKN